MVYLRLNNIQICISQLLNLGYINLVQSCIEKFLSPIIFTQKLDGSHRFILNLKKPK